MLSNLRGRFRSWEPYIKPVMNVAFAVLLMGVGVALGSCTGPRSAPAQILPHGWQFYARPTDKEPPGTVFRIDESGKRFIVTTLAGKPMVAKEVQGRSHERISTNADMVARFLGSGYGAAVTAKGAKEHDVEFEIENVEREFTTDEDVSPEKLSQLWDTVVFKKNSRYYVIREAISATAIDFVLTESLVGELGGKAGVNSYASGDVKVSHNKEKGYILQKPLIPRMRVAFLPDEIIRAGSSLGGEKPQLVLKPVKGQLLWNETQHEPR